MLPTWQSEFADGTFHDWTSWIRNNGGTYFVTTPARAKIPPPPPCAGTHIAEFEVTAKEAAEGRINSKLYKGWDVGALHRIDDLSRPFARLHPGQEGGVYSAWFFLPRDFRMQAKGVDDIFQFKEDYQTPDQLGSTAIHSDVQTDVSIWNATTLKTWTDVLRPQAYDFPRLPKDYPLLAVALFDKPAVRPRPGHQRIAIPAPLGRWFNITAKLYPHSRVEYYVDGRLLDVWHEDEYPVGVRYPHAVGWTFGVGNYGANVGRLWVADASFTSFSPALRSTRACSAKLTVDDPDRAGRRC